MIFLIFLPFHKGQSREVSDPFMYVCIHVCNAFVYLCVYFIILVPPNHFLDFLGAFMRYPL